MSTGLFLLVCGVVWLAAAIALALVIGAAIRRGDQVTHIDDDRIVDFDFNLTNGGRADETRPAATHQTLTRRT